MDVQEPRDIVGVAGGGSCRDWARERTRHGKGVSKGHRGCQLRWEILLSDVPAGWKGSQGESEPPRLEAALP